MEPEQNNEHYKNEQEQQPERRSIRDLRIARPQQKREVRQVFKAEQEESQDTGGRPWIIYAVIATVTCLVLAALLPVVFPEATVTVTPVSVKTTQDPTITAYPTSTEGALSYTVESWAVTVTKPVEPTVTETVSEKASGTIKISNTNGKDQKLIKNTRFESSEGKIYRVRDSIVVPAQGTLEVKVYADEGGESFNTTSATFKLPGLKGSDLYDKVTAATVGPIQGGFSGTRKSIDAAEKKKITSALESELIEAVRSGKNYGGTGMIIRKTTSADVGEVTETAQGDQVLFTLTAEAKALFVQKEDLASALASEAGSPVQSKRIAFTGTVPELTATEAFDAARYGKKPVQIQVPGEHTLTYTVDREQLAKDLAGAPRDDIKPRLGKFPEIEKAIATVRPFWRSKLPGNAEKITIKLEGEVEKTEI